MKSIIKIIVEFIDNPVTVVMSILIGLVVFITYMENIETEKRDAWTASCLKLGGEPYGEILCLKPNSIIVVPYNYKQL